MGKYVSKKNNDRTLTIKSKWLVILRDKRWGVTIIEHFDKRSEAVAYAKKCNAREDRCGLFYTLRWWFNENDELAGEEQLDLTPDDVHDLFAAQSDYPDHPPIFCYTVTSSTKNKLGELKHKIDLNEFDYTVETD